jgi:hypothetical protein
MAFRIDQLSVYNIATVENSITAGSFVKTGGTASQFLKANGTVDSTAYLNADIDSEQTVGGRIYYFNEGAKRMNVDPRWNESGYDADLGTLHIWAWTAGGAAYGRAGIALYNGSAYQYLTTKASTTGMFINNTQVVTNSGTWSISISGNASTASTASNSSQLSGYSLDGATSVGTRIFNNKGQNHSTYTNFNTIMSPGPNFIQGPTNGPTGTSGAQWYGFMLGLGQEYGTSTGSSGHYASQLYYSRISQESNQYLWARDMESGAWGSWRKLYAGYADSAGSVAWTNVSGRPTALSSFSNDTGYITGINSSNVTNALGYTPFNSGSWGGNYHYGLSSNSTTTGTRWRIGRVYYNACHWGNYGIMKIKARTTYYNGGYIEWTISNRPGGVDMKTTDHSLTQTGSFNCFLGGATLQGASSGCDTYYRDIFIEVGPYIGINIDFTWNATTNIDSNDGGGGNYSNFVIYTGGNRTQTNQGISSPLVEYRAPRITGDTLAVNTTDPAVNGLVADFNGAIGIRNASRLYFGHSNNNFNSWSTAIYASGSTMLFNAQTHTFNNEGYGSTFSTTINASGITSSSILLTGSLVNNTDGAVMMESNASENNNWLWKENAKQWGIFWFNRGSQSGQTIGTYSTVGAETMFMGGNTGVGMPAGYSGYIAGSNIAAMISSYDGYIYSHSKIFANDRFESRNGIYFERGGNSYTTFVRPANHPDQGYSGSGDKYWVELGSYGGVHVTLNMDGSAGSGENAFDHFTIWQAAANSSSGSRQFYVTNIGNVWARNDITAFSDIRVKENIRPIENALQKVVNSRGVMYDRIDTGEKNGIGFIAQELEIQIPDLVKSDDKGFKSVKYQNMVAILTEAIKEQQKQIEELKSRLNAVTK